MKISALVLVGALSLTLLAPGAAHASSRGKRNTAIALGAVAAYGLIKKQPLVAGVAGAGAIYSYLGSRKEADREHDRDRWRDRNYGRYSDYGYDRDYGYRDHGYRGNSDYYSRGYDYNRGYGSRYDSSYDRYDRYDRNSRDCDRSGRRRR